MGSFNYNQLNIVGRDKDDIIFIKNALINELESLKKDIGTDSSSFKNVINVANEVWSGSDKDLFIKNLRASATEFYNSIDTIESNIKKYIDQDLASFDSLQSSTKKIASSSKN